jgi:hypothetical protein
MNNKPERRIPVGGYLEIDPPKQFTLEGQNRPGGRWMSATRNILNAPRAAL